MPLSSQNLRHCFSLKDLQISDERAFEATARRGIGTWVATCAFKLTRGMGVPHLQGIELVTTTVHRCGYLVDTPKGAPNCQYSVIPWWEDLNPTRPPKLTQSKRILGIGKRENVLRRYVQHRRLQQMRQKLFRGRLQSVTRTLQLPCP